MSGMEKKLLTTVLIYSFAEVLQELITKKTKETCSGWQVEHPSQHNHECLMNGEQEHLERHFETACRSFLLLDVLIKFREDVKKLNMSSEFVCNYFLLNVIVLDRLRSQPIKDSVYRLMEKRIKSQLFASMEKEINNITFHEGLPSSDQVDACSKDCACSLKMTKEMILIPKHKFEAVLQKQNENQPKAEVVLNDIPSRDDDKHNLSYDQKPLHDDLQSLINITIPSRYKDKALRLLLYLQKQPSIKWDEQGEVCIDGKVISNTYIVDLIRDSTVPIGRRKLTAGIHQFYQFLKSTNIPLCLFRNVEKTNKDRFESTPYKEKKTEEENKEKEETDEYSEDSDNEYIQRNKKTKKTETNLETQKKMYVQRDINSIFTIKKEKKMGLGEVVAVGPGTSIAVGTPVMYMVYGAFSEYKVVPTNRLTKVKKIAPEYLPCQVSAGTAAISLDKLADLKSGETVFVSAAAGGTGQFATISVFGSYFYGPELTVPPYVYSQTI
ncbi:PTGR3 [Mytilus edulis]|uniref:PTGR3 n=1 Tax=Mytilus edulis TaxID=6550 RepID=A0A8S3Q6C3_MYTED|nr:PTGR3 [Mytilus edulis]